MAERVASEGAVEPRRFRYSVAGVAPVVLVVTLERRATVAPVETAEPVGWGWRVPTVRSMRQMEPTVVPVVRAVRAEPAA
jgi:hypothetical protein